MRRLPGHREGMLFTDCYATDAKRSAYCRQRPTMWFIMKADLWLELIALKNAINEIERDITILEEQRQLTRHIQIDGQLAFDFPETLAALPK
jgi:hypothetical protein